MDREKLRRLYVRGDKSLKSLAEETGMPGWKVAKWAAKDGWAAEKRLLKKEREACFQEEEKRNSRNEAQDGEEKLQPLRQASEGLCAHLASMAEEGALKELNPQGLHQLAGTLKDMVTVVRNLHDLPALTERKEKQEPVLVEFAGQTGQIVESMKGKDVQCG